MTPIKGYIHVATMGSWRQVLEEQITLIRRCGLNNRSTINLCKVGTETDENLQWAIQFDDLEKFEFPTLARLYENADQGLSFYTHLKGVSKTLEHWKEKAEVYKEFAGLYDLKTLQHHERLWRKYMEYFVIERYRDCIKMLDTHDICGVHWREKPAPHYSGNFFWATDRYVKSLDHPYDFFKKHEDYLDVMRS